MVRVTLQRVVKNPHRERFTIQRAIEISHQAGSLNQAGIAALTLIEEIDDLSADILSSAYEQAGEWLAETESNALLLRFKRAGSKLAAKLRTDDKANTTETLFKRGNFKEALLEVERELIRRALAEANGSVTHAAPLLSTLCEDARRRERGLIQNRAL